MDLQITENIVIPESDIRLHFIHAGGPGGQKVNKTASAVQLRFNVNDCQALTDVMRRRLYRLAGNRISADGTLVIDARRFRSQTQNRTDALERLAMLIKRATLTPRIRRPTAPSRRSRQNRMEAKKRRSRLKQQRSPVSGEDG